MFCLVIFSIPSSDFLKMLYLCVEARGWGHNFLLLIRSLSFIIVALLIAHCRLHIVNASNGLKVHLKSIHWLYQIMIQ